MFAVDAAEITTLKSILKPSNSVAVCVRVLDNLQFVQFSAAVAGT